MPHIASKYKDHENAPMDMWVCTPDSKLGPCDSAPIDESGSPGFCGQCVSYVKTVCSTLKEKNTRDWRKGIRVKGATEIKEGTAIATFDTSGKYQGHAAIYVSQDPTGIQVYDQYVSGSNPKPIGPRTLRFVGNGVNDASSYYVVE